MAPRPEAFEVFLVRRGHVDRRVAIKRLLFGLSIAMLPMKTPSSVSASKCTRCRVRSGPAGNASIASSNSRHDHPLVAIGGEGSSVRSADRPISGHIVARAPRALARRRILGIRYNAR